MTAGRIETPFLAPDPPPWVVRALAGLLLALSAVVGAVVVLVRVPESVSAPFVVAPAQGAAPVRTLHDGIVTAVLVSDAQRVAAGTVLFTIGSEQVGDRSAERDALGATLSGGDMRRTNERERYDNQRRADEQELARLDQRAQALRAQLALREQQWALAREVLGRQLRAVDEGLVSWMDVSKYRMDADRLELEVQQTRADIAEAVSGQARLRFEMASRQAAFEELLRGVTEELGQARARKGMIERDGPRDGNLLPVIAACSGMVVRLHVTKPGTVVVASDPLAEIVCEHQPLRAEILVPQGGLALVAPGQAVKLQYDAFPYQRYGVRYATVRWVSPASVTADGGAAFRVLADLDEQSLPAGAPTHVVLPGMGGQATIIVGRRSLASYAFEPLRQLRESASTDRPSVTP